MGVRDELRNSVCPSARDGTRVRVRDELRNSVCPSARPGVRVRALNGDGASDVRRPLRTGAITKGALRGPRA